MCLDPHLNWGWGWRRETGISPPVKYFTDRSKAVLLLWIFYGFFLSVSYAFVRACLFVPCGHLLWKGWPPGSRLWCITVSLSLSHWYPGSGVWYWIVSIHDLCTLTYFVVCEQLRRSAVLSRSLLNAILKIRFMKSIISKFASCKLSIFQLFSVAEHAGLSAALSEIKEEGKDQETIQSSTTPDPEHHMGKWQKHKKTWNTGEPRG